MTIFSRLLDPRKHTVIAGILTVGFFFSTLSALSTAASCALAQSVAATHPLAASSAKLSVSAGQVAGSSTVKMFAEPTWQALSPTQQASLKPLAANWNTLGEAQKRKWIAIAANYANLSTPEQTKLHSRMTEWVSLSQSQREQARLNFGKAKQLDPGKKSATWEAYQALSPDEKKQLAISAPSKPTGAAAAVKPVSPQKLTTVPITRLSTKESPEANANGQKLNRNTLLPLAQVPASSVPAQQYQPIPLNR
jgi:hypothetical protein